MDKQQIAIIELLLKKDAEEIASILVQSKKMEPSESVNLIRNTVTELGIKAIEIKNLVIKKSGKPIEGDKYIAQENFDNYFVKGREYEVTGVRDNSVYMNDLVEVRLSDLMQFFRRK